MVAVGFRKVPGLSYASSIELLMQFCSYRTGLEGKLKYGKEELKRSYHAEFIFVALCVNNFGVKQVMAHSGINRIPKTSNAVIE